MITYKRIYNKNFISEKPLEAGIFSGLRDKEYFLTGNVRGGLLFLFDNLGIGKGDTILLPAFAPHGLILPARKRGITINFYRLTKELTPDTLDLENRIQNSVSVKAVVVIQYFGYYSDLCEISLVSDKYGILLLEDRAHMVFEPSNFKSSADVIFYSLAKLLPVPDGALFIINSSELKIQAKQLKRNPANSLAVFFSKLELNFRTLETKTYSKMLRSLYSSIGTILHAIYYFLICLPNSASPISKETIKLLERFNIHDAMERRRNMMFRILSMNIMNNLPLAYRKYNGEATPGIPVISNNSDQETSKLSKVGIKVLSYNKYWWFVPENQEDDYKWERYIHDNHYLIPVNENMTDKDADELEAQLKKIFDIEHSG